jgi:integrase/recombinase XerD
MTALAPTLEAFFTQRLAVQRDASPHTVAAYHDTLRLLVVFARNRTGKAPSRLDVVGDIDAPLVAAFLTPLETERHNSVSTRNTRLAAIHSLFRYAALSETSDNAAYLQ